MSRLDKLMFWKKKKKLPFEYKAMIFVPSVDSMQAQLTVETKLIRDKTDHLLYLVDTDTSGDVFKELFPGENKKIFENTELATLKSSLKKKGVALGKLTSKSVENPLNLKKEISQLKVLIQQYEEPGGTFVIQNGAGEKIIYYLRKSSGLSPIHFDIHSNLAYSPTEKQSKDAFNAWKTKFENLKSNPPMPFEKITAAISGLVLAVLVIVLSILVWNWYLHESDWDQMKIDQKYICDTTALDKQNEIISTNAETSNYLNEFAKQQFDLGTNNVQSPQTDTIG